MIKAKLVTNNFRKLERATVERLAKKVNRQMVNAASIARQLCPVDTGALRETIAVMTTNGGQVVFLTAGSDEVTYAAFVERDQPFIGPAVESVKKDLPRALKGYLK